MPHISGGKVALPSPNALGVKLRIYWVDNAVPSDANIGYDGTPPNGTIAVNTTNGNVYERQAGVWTRIDTL
jgi:hypothetical protein